MADNVNLKIFQGLIIISLILGSGVAIDFQFDKKTTNLYRNGDLIAVSDFIVNAERTYFNLDSYYDEKVKCPKVEAMGGHRTATRCYYPDNYYERIKRDLLRTDISANEFTNKYTTTKTTPYYAYGTRGAKAGILYEGMEFDKKTQSEEDFPNSYNVMWTPKDTRNYQITWRLQKLDTSNYADGSYYACDYVFGNVKIDLLDNCQDLNKVELSGNTALFYFVNSRGIQDFDLMFVDPEVKEKEEPKETSSLIDGWDIDVDSSYISNKFDYSVDVVSRDTFGKPTEIKVNWNWKVGEKATLLPATDKVSQIALDATISARDEEYTVTHCSKEPPYGCILIPHMRYYLGKEFDKQDYDNIISMKQKGLPTNRKLYIDVEKDKGSFTTEITETTPVKIGFNTTVITLLYRNNDSYQPNPYVDINMSITDIDLSQMEFFFGQENYTNWDTLGQNSNRTGVSLSAYGPKTNATLFIKNISGTYDEFSGVAVHDGYVYVASKGDEKVRKLNAFTGEEIWSFSAHRVDSTIVYHNNIVYFGCYSHTSPYTYSVNATTGIQIWNFTGNLWVGATAIDEENNKVYVNNGDGNWLYALNLTTGIQIWNYSNDCVGQASSPTYYNGVVYAPCKNDAVSFELFLSAVNSTTGIGIWEARESNQLGAHDSSPLIYKDKIYLGTQLIGADSFYVLYLNGTIDWSIAQGQVYTTPALHNDIVWFGGDSSMYSYYTNGTYICNYTTGNSIYSTPTIVDGVVYFGSNDNYVYAINENDCSLLWSYETGDEVYGQAVVANNIFYINSDDGNLYAFGDADNYALGERTKHYDDSLVLMMNFENRTVLGESNSKVVDLSSSQNNGTIYGATYTDSGKHGKALSFDGSNDYVSCGLDSSLIIPDTITYEASFKLNEIYNSSNVNSIYLIRIGSSNWIWLGFTSSTGQALFGGNIVKRAYSTQTEWEADKWYHLVGTYDKNAGANNVKLYIDGVLIGTATDTDSFAYPDAPFKINYDGNLNGSIDSVRIYNRALTADEINQSYISNLDKYTADDWRFTTNQTDLTEGKYQFYAWVNDTAGVETTSTLYSYTYDAGSPYIQFELPTATNNTYTARNWTMINVTTTDNLDTTAFIDFNNSLVGWWRLNDNSTQDYSSYQNNGTNHGSTYTTAGKFGGAREFDGVDDYVDCGNDESLNITTGTITFESWVKANTLIQDSLIIQQNVPSGIGKIGLGIYNTNNVVFLGTHTNPIGLSNVSLYIKEGIYQYWVLVYDIDNDIFLFYLDGIQQSLSNVGSFWAIDSGTFRIGSRNTARYFNGTIDEVKIYNRALSPEEINASYNAGLYRLYNNFTDLAEGQYTYTAYSQDLAGNVNQTETRTIVINDTCVCPGVAATWIPNMASLCNITSNCNLTTGSIYFDYSTTGAGNFTVSNCNFSALEYFMGYDFMIEGTGEWFVN